MVAGTSSSSGAAAPPAIAVPPAFATPSGPAIPELPSRRPIVVIIPMPPSFRGGTEEYAYQLVREYSRHHEVHVLASSVRWKPDGEHLSYGSARLLLLDASELWQRPVVRGARAWRMVRTEVEGAGVVQLHMPFPRVERKVARWAAAAGVPLVLTYHMDAEFGEHPERWLPRTLAGAYRRLSALPALHGARVIVSNSLGYARASPVLSQLLDRVRVIYQGVDVERLEATRPSDADFVPPRQAGVGRVVFIGRIVPYKGLPDLLRALVELRARGRAVECLIGGRGPQLDELKALATELGLDATVRFLGFVPDGAVGPLYRSADVVACPSVSLLESTPITLQEALAFGVPVLGTTLPGTEETIPNDGRRGRLVPPRDPVALAAALAELLDAPRGPASGLRRLWSDTARDYLALFRDLEVASSRGPGGRA
jgi:glycosyltransferase involved in cell wall biosynthesis